MRTKRMPRRQAMMRMYSRRWVVVRLGTTSGSADRPLLCDPSPGPAVTLVGRSRSW